MHYATNDCSNRARQARRSRAAAIAVALGVLVPLACGDDDDTADGSPQASTTSDDVSTTPTAETSDTSSSGGSTPGTPVTTVMDPTNVCLPPEGERPDVGSIIEILFEEVTLDCEAAGGGEKIHARSIVKTDDNGVAAIAIGESDQCVLRPSIEVIVRPEPDTALDVVSEGDDEEVQCWVARLLRLPHGTIRPLGGAIEVVIDLDGDAVVIVVEGFASVEPSGTDCSAIVGPRQQVGLSSDGTSKVAAVDPRSLGAAVAETVASHGRVLEPPLLNGGLAAGLADALRAGEATLSVDGSNAAGSGSDVIGVLVGTGIELPATIRQNALAPDSEALVVATAGEVSEPTDPSTPATTGDGTSITDAPADELLEVVELPVLVDPGGSIWTAGFDAADGALRDFKAQFFEALRSGSYGRTYEAEFGETPAYRALIPDLLGERQPC